MEKDLSYIYTWDDMKKYTPKKNRFYSENDLEKIRKTACAAYKVLDTTGLARVDFFIERNTKQVYLNEINTMPGFTPISMFPKLCDAAGLKFNALIELLIEEAIARYEAKCKLVTNRT